MKNKIKIHEYILKYINHMNQIVKKLTIYYIIEELIDIKYNKPINKSEEKVETLLYYILHLNFQKIEIFHFLISLNFEYIFHLMIYFFLIVFFLNLKVYILHIVISFKRFFIIIFIFI